MYVEYMLKNQSNKVLKSTLKTLKLAGGKEKKVSFSDPLEMVGLPAVKVAKPKAVAKDGLEIIGVEMLDNAGAGRDWDRANPFFQAQVLPQRFRDHRNAVPAREVAPRSVMQFFDRGVGEINPVTWRYMGVPSRVEKVPSAIARGAVAMALMSARGVESERGNPF